ncbi:nicotinate phosphoribosyltransferase [Pedobacter heparinus]|uniref:Nicotinate phosphoribosyltransferase n=1 Tax=Pedobacter heparinus (strain ATCC 13125 / DSM 2366 / CIP 104194 / JCM 7457 / NBRC 12017 / NCIMB 9290 / NRRL B-14731 / HIM 762-3) TaxID=485917 RepID=C6XX06_PEDHD|nr:nicotinate phosphoribosyltransferase [Pedobacter heparinus]ACU04300.1 nicotinate phosphoribosyltransferase [Pedobacter heparinus DSM 2366]
MALMISVLDNDFYKVTMQQGVVRLFPAAKARYQFINRGKHSFPEGFAVALRKAVDEMALLKLSKAEKHFLQVNCPYLDPVYLDFLEGYRFNPEEVHIEQHEDQLQVKVEGFWYRTILWEVPLMSLICELYYVLTGAKRISNEAIIEVTRKKIEAYKALGVTIAEFGTRRRYAYDVQRLVLQSLSQYGAGSFIGTSNMHLAMLHQTKPIGTHAHEWFMFHAARYGFTMANAMGLEHWVQVYRGDLGIALSDTYTTDVFFKQFDRMYAKLFDGVRHDSADPLVFADKVISHYERMGIDPKSKTIIFSDGLDYEKVERIARHCLGRVGMSFGIGTNFTNDAGLPPMNIVIKMTEAHPQDGQWTKVVKLSDEEGKYTGDIQTINLAKTILGIS